MAQNGSYLYSGTGDSGIVLRSLNGSFWEVYYQAEDINVTSLFVYNNTMYIGTSPAGKIYVADLSDNTVALSKEIGGTISGFAYFYSNMYVATSNPSGIYKYNTATTEWDFVFKPYGTVVYKLMVSGDRLFIFMNVGNIITYDGSDYKLLLLDGEST